MPLTLSTGAELVGQATFQYRVAMAFYFVAREVLSEKVDVVGHEVRVAFARSIVTQDYTQFMQYAAMVATSPTVVAGGPYVLSGSTSGQDQSKVTDAVIIDAVRGMWNWLAGVGQ